MKTGNLECIGYVDWQLIQEARSYTAAKKDRKSWRWALVAACLILVLCLGWNRWSTPLLAKSGRAEAVYTFPYILPFFGETEEPSLYLLQSYEAYRAFLTEHPFASDTEPLAAEKAAETFTYEKRFFDDACLVVWTGDADRPALPYRLFSDREGSALTLTFATPDDLDISRQYFPGMLVAEISQKLLEGAEYLEVLKYGFAAGGASYYTAAKEALVHKEAPVKLFWEKGYREAGSYPSGSSAYGKCENPEGKTDTAALLSSVDDYVKFYNENGVIFESSGRYSGPVVNNLYMYLWVAVIQAADGFETSYKTQTRFFPESGRMEVSLLPESRLYGGASEGGVVTFVPIGLHGVKDNLKELAVRVYDAEGNAKEMKLTGGDRQ